MLTVEWAGNEAVQPTLIGESGERIPLGEAVPLVAIDHAYGCIETLTRLEHLASPSDASHQGDLQLRLTDLGCQLGEAIGWKAPIIAGLARYRLITNSAIARLPLELLPALINGTTQPLGVAACVSRGLLNGDQLLKRPPVGGGRQGALIVNTHVNRLEAKGESEAFDREIGHLQEISNRAQCASPVLFRAGIFASSSIIEDLIDQINGKLWVHFTGHGTEDGAFVLDQDRQLALRPQDLRIHLSRLKRPPRLVWVNSCYGGFGINGVSLAEAFLDLGAETVIGATIPIANAAATEAATHFHSRWLRSTPAGHAMLETRRMLWQIGSAYWAGLQLYGNENLINL